MSLQASMALLGTVVVLGAAALAAVFVYARLNARPPDDPSLAKPAVPAPVPLATLDIVVRGSLISRASTADDVVRVLRPEDAYSHRMIADPDIPGSLIVVTRYMVDGQNFELTFSRLELNGPYFVAYIRRPPY